MACLVLLYGVWVNICDPTLAMPQYYDAPPPRAAFQSAYDNTWLLNQLLIQRELTSPDRLPRCVPGIC